MKRRVAFLVGTLNTGGIERSVVDWCLYLMEHTDWVPSVICLLRRGGPFLTILQERGVQIEECKLHRLGFTFRLKRLLEKLGPEVVHSQVAFSMPWQVLGIRFSGRRKIIFTQQNEYQNWSPWIARIRLRLYFFVFFRSIDHYTCVSHQVRSSLTSLTGRSIGDFAVIPNSVNTNRFVINPEFRKDQRIHLRVPETIFLVGMVGRFSAQKGHKYLIEASSILRERGKLFKIVLIGVGELEAVIRQEVEVRNLGNYIIFYGQTLEVQKMLQAFDCFILPSLWEGMPLALLEAMAVGLPVIGTDVAGTREVIENEVTGLLIPSKNPTAIADALIRLMDDRKLRTRLANQAQSFVKGRYSVEVSISAYLTLYER